MKETGAASAGSVMKNFLWRLAERVGAQGVKLLVELVLARILMPEEYGLIAMVTVFITVFNVFVDSGLGNALIQKKDADELDFASVFWFNVTLCVVLYGVLYLISPAIAAFYQREELCPVLRVLGLQIVISGVKNVYQAYVSRTMQFRKFFFATLGGTLGAAVIGITMAYRGYGVWALVAQQLFNVLTDTVILCLTVKWHPKREFSFERLKGLLSYGWKLLISALLDTAYNEARSLIIGKKYTSEDLAFYNRGELFPQVIAANVNTSIDSVVIETINLKAKSVKQHVFNKRNGKWMLTAINKNTMYQNQNKSFLSFYEQFASDSIFQIQSLNDPVNATIPDPEDDYAMMEGEFHPDQWDEFKPYILPDDTIYNVLYGQKYNISKKKCGYYKY